MEPIISLEAFNQPDLSPAEVEIRAWLKGHKEYFAGMDAGEVAHLAVLCGFALNDVCKTLSNFADAMNGSNLDNRASFHVWRVEMAVYDFSQLKAKLEKPKELDLSSQWKELTAYTTTGESL